MRREELRRIVASVLDCSPNLLQGETLLADFESFDSVAILSLMVALDDEAGVKLEHTDVAKIVRYSDIENVVVAKGMRLES